jgi:hypothetical protein
MLLAILLPKDGGFGFMTSTQEKWIAIDRRK